MFDKKVARSFKADLNKGCLLSRVILLGGISICLKILWWWKDSKRQKRTSLLVENSTQLKTASTQVLLKASLNLNSPD